MRFLFLFDVVSRYSPGYWLIFLDVVLRVRPLFTEAHGGKAPWCDMYVGSTVGLVTRPSRLVDPTIDPDDLLHPGHRGVDGAIQIADRHDDGDERRQHVLVDLRNDVRRLRVLALCRRNHSQSWGHRGAESREHRGELRQNLREHRRHAPLGHGDEALPEHAEHAKDRPGRVHEHRVHRRGQPHAELVNGERQDDAPQQRLLCRPCGRRLKCLDRREHRLRHRQRQLEQVRQRPRPRAVLELLLQCNDASLHLHVRLRLVRHPARERLGVRDTLDLEVVLRLGLSRRHERLLGHRREHVPQAADRGSRMQRGKRRRYHRGHWLNRPQMLSGLARARCRWRRGRELLRRSKRCFLRSELRLRLVELLLHLSQFGRLFGDDLRTCRRRRGVFRAVLHPSVARRDRGLLFCFWGDLFCLFDCTEGSNQWRTEVDAETLCPRDKLCRVSDLLAVLVHEHLKRLDRHQRRGHFVGLFGTVRVFSELATVRDRLLLQVDLRVETQRRLAHRQGHELRFCWRARRAFRRVVRDGLGRVAKAAHQAVFLRILALRPFLGSAEVEDAEVAVILARARPSIALLVRGRLPVLAVAFLGLLVALLDQRGDDVVQH